MPNICEVLFKRNRKKWKEKKNADLKYNLPARFKDIPSKAISMLSLSLSDNYLSSYYDIIQ